MVPSFTNFGRYKSLALLLAKRRVSLKTVTRILVVRLRNRINFGKNSPFPHSRGWCCPMCITRVNSSFNKSDSGKVLSGNWDLATEKLSDPLRANLTYLQNKIWLEEKVENFQQSSVFISEKDRLLRKGKSLDWIQQRFEQLDLLRTLVRDSKSLPKSLEGFKEFEFNGIPISIGRDGGAISAGGGSHRLALAQYFKIDVIPVEIFVVHSDSITMFDWRDDIQLPCKCYLANTKIT